MSEEGLIHVVEKIVRTIRTCLGILEWKHRHHETRKAIEKVEADPALIVPRFFSSSFQLTHTVDHSFSQEARIYIELPSSFRGSRGLPIDTLTVTVKWASGGGTVAMALAQATVIRDCVEKAAQCEITLREELRELGEDQWLAALTVLKRRQEAEWAKVHAYLGPEEDR